MAVIPCMAELNGVKYDTSGELVFKVSVSQKIQIPRGYFAQIVGPLGRSQIVQKLGIWIEGSASSSVGLNYQDLGWVGLVHFLRSLSLLSGDLLVEEERRRIRSRGN